jgi:hypothetical protein
MPAESFAGNTNEALKSRLEIIGAPEESEQFPGSKIVTVKEGDEYVRYALRRSPNGELEGNSFKLQEYKIVNGTGGSGFWDSSDARVDAEGVLEIDGKEQPKFRLVGSQQMQFDELANIEATLREKGIEI